MASKKKVTIIGIAGGTASGKTTIADKLFDSTKLKGSVLYIKMDDYYKKFDDIPVNEHCVKNFDHPDSYDIDLLTKLKEYIKNKYNKPGNVYLGLIHRLHLSV